MGWSTLRWNSNVHREASLTITVGATAAPADAPIGPRGPRAPHSEPVRAPRPRRAPRRLPCPPPCALRRVVHNSLYMFALFLLILYGTFWGRKPRAASLTRGRCAWACRLLSWARDAQVIQLEYAYGCKPIRQAPDGGFASLVLAAADGAAAELTDPDEYRVLLTAA